MQTNDTASVVTWLVINNVISYMFIYLLISRLLGYKVFERRLPPTAVEKE